MLWPWSRGVGGIPTDVTGGKGHSDGVPEGSEGSPGEPWLRSGGVSDGLCELKQGDEPGFGKSQFRGRGRNTRCSRGEAWRSRPGREEERLNKLMPTT